MNEKKLIEYLEEEIETEWDKRPVLSYDSGHRDGRAIAFKMVLDFIKESEEEDSV